MEISAHRSGHGTRKEETLIPNRVENLTDFSPHNLITSICGSPSRQDYTKLMVVALKLEVYQRLKTTSNTLSEPRGSCSRSVLPKTSHVDATGNPLTVSPIWSIDSAVSHSTAPHKPQVGRATTMYEYMMGEVSPVMTLDPHIVRHTHPQSFVTVQQSCTSTRSCPFWASHWQPLPQHKTTQPRRHESLVACS